MLSKFGISEIPGADSQVNHVSNEKKSGCLVWVCRGLYFPVMWAPTVITGVISPINGLITGFHWGYFTPKSSGVTFQLVESLG